MAAVLRSTLQVFEVRENGLLGFAFPPTAVLF